MYIERHILDPYPYDGVFYYEETTASEDGSLFDEDEDSSEDGSLFDEGEDEGDTISEDDADAETDESTDADTEDEDEDEDEADSDTTEVIVLETKCDIQESNKLFNNGAIMSNFTIYFPFEKGVDALEIRRGHMFRCESVEGLPVNGTVIGVFPTQMGGCVAYIKQVDV